jgi:hypothetical protein
MGDDARVLVAFQSGDHVNGTSYPRVPLALLCVIRSFFLAIVYLKLFLAKPLDRRAAHMFPTFPGVPLLLPVQPRRRAHRICTYATLLYFGLVVADLLVYEAVLMIFR